MSAILDKMKQAVVEGKVFKQGNYLRPGAIYDLEVQGLTNASRKPFAIVEVKVLSTTPTLSAEVLAKLPPDKQPNAPGTEAGLTFDLSTEWGGGLLLGCLMALTGDTEEAFKADGGAALDYLFSDAQPCKYLRIIDEAFEKAKKGTKDDMRTRHKYTHVPQTEKNKEHLKSLEKK